MGQHAFLLPKQSAEETTPPSHQHALSIANPLAHPIVHETERALQLSTNTFLQAPNPFSNTPNTVTSPLASVPVLRHVEPTIARGTDCNNANVVADTSPNVPVPANRIGARHLFHSVVPTDANRYQVFALPDGELVPRGSSKACPDNTQATTAGDFQHVQPHPSCVPLIKQNILLSPMEASSKKRSPFWQAFHQFNNKHPKNTHEHHAACNLCGKAVNMGRDNSTTTLSQHLRKCNRALWAKLKDTVVVVPKPKAEQKRKLQKAQAAEEIVEEPNDLPSSAGSSRPLAPSSTSLKSYIEVAFRVRFKDPPEEEWAGLIMILHKELESKLSRETIGGIFQRLSTKRAMSAGAASSKRPKHQHSTSTPATATFAPTSIPIVSGSASSSLSSKCDSPVLLNLDKMLPGTAECIHPCLPFPENGIILPQTKALL